MKMITLPNNWLPRPYQRKGWEAWEHGIKRLLYLWHRRAGKDDNSLHMMAVATQQKVASYWYLLPKGEQCRKSMWDAVNPHTGKRRIDEAFPEEIRAKTRDDRMTITFRNGSVLSFLGADNYNNAVGSPPYGIVFSEYSLTSPLAWPYLQPILEENGGWAIFNFTARGRNHAARMFEAKQKDPAWFVQRCTPPETGVFTKEQLDRIKQDLIDLYGEDDGEAIYNQEYWCSFDAALVGAYFAKELARMEQKSQITFAPYDPTTPVYTSWDLGIDDSTAIWVVQVIGLEVRIVDYYEANGYGLEHYTDWLNQRGYCNYAEHFLPHDVEVRELGTGRSRLDTLDKLGVRADKVRIIPPTNPAERVSAIRALLPRCRFDADNTSLGLEALRNYRREYDEERKIYKPIPVHDWSSHGTDAFGHLALGLRIEDAKDKRTKKARPAPHSRLC